MKVSKIFTVLLLVATIFTTFSHQASANDTIKEQHAKNLMVVKSLLWHDGVEIIDHRLGEQNSGEEQEGKVVSLPEELTIPLMDNL